MVTNLDIKPMLVRVYRSEARAYVRTSSDADEDQVCTTCART